MPNRINLWSSPRNISTALMYSFAQRDDTQVHDEPLYAHYLHLSGKNHPGRKEILKSQSRSGQHVVENILLQEKPAKPVQIFKQMTHHLIDLDPAFLFKMKNVMLIRDPAEIIFSYGKVIDKIEMQDIGIEAQVLLAQQLEQQDALQAVVDAKELLLNPEKVLQILCERLDLNFKPNMLSWKPGARSEDGVWAKHWYANVHQSKGFQAYKKREVQLNEAQSELNAICQPMYSELYRKAIKA